MAFAKKQFRKYPRRLWQLIGPAAAGKSHFAARMRAPLLPIDADHRIDEIKDLNPDMLELSLVAADHNNPDRIAALLQQNMPGSNVGTIVVDSLTAIIAPLVTQAMVDKDAGRSKNLYAGFKDKALAMRQLQDAVTKWGCDVLWISHQGEATDAQGATSLRETISKTENLRLLRSINLKMEIVLRDGQRGIRVLLTRKGRPANKIPILWDESGTWKDMPERIEAAVYDGLTPDEIEAIDNSLPETFADDAIAIDWGLEKGAFNELTHARNAYEKLMREHGDPGEMEEKSALWIGDVLARLEERKQGQGNGPGSHDGSREADAPTKPVGPTEFWERANALRMRDAAQGIYKAHTVGKNTDWAAALQELEKQGAAA